MLSLATLVLSLVGAASARAAAPHRVPIVDAVRFTPALALHECARGTKAGFLPGPPTVEFLSEEE